MCKNTRHPFQIIMLPSTLLAQPRQTPTNSPHPTQRLLCIYLCSRGSLRLCLFRCYGSLCLGSCSRCGFRCVLLVLDRVVLSLEFPLCGLGEGRVLPWALVAELTAAGALASTTESLGQAVGGNVLEQLLLVTAAENVDLLNRDGVDPALDDGPDSGETPWGVDDEQLAQTLGVVVLGHVGGRLQVAVHGGGLAQTNALEVHDRAASLEQVARFAGASRQTGVGDALVFDGQVGQHTFRGGDLVQCVDIDIAKLLNVDWSTVLFVFGKLIYAP